MSVARCVPSRIGTLTFFRETTSKAAGSAFAGTDGTAPLCARRGASAHRVETARHRIEYRIVLIRMSKAEGGRDTRTQTQGAGSRAQVILHWTWEAQPVRSIGGNLESSGCA